jgi:hypothetical protein
MAYNLQDLAMMQNEDSSPLTQSAKRRAQSVRQTVNGKPITRWLRDGSPFTIYRSMFFSLCSMRYALCKLD